MYCIYLLAPSEGSVIQGKIVMTYREKCVLSSSALHRCMDLTPA
jgi:hypothetical protein